MAIKRTNVPLAFDGLISVPIESRPKPSEVRPYLKNLQSHVLTQTRLAMDLCDQDPNALAELQSDLSKLFTSLSTETQYIRIPVVWSIWKKLCEQQQSVSERLVDSTAVEKQLAEVTQVLGVYLSHFDLSDHLSESYKRQINGDPNVDTAFFHELETRVSQFEESRNGVFSNELERTKRLSSVLSLPSGVVPKATYLSILFFRNFQVATNMTAKFLSAIAAGWILAATSGALPSLKPVFAYLLGRLGLQ